jgi:hypothetical protein
MRPFPCFQLTTWTLCVLSLAFVGLAFAEPEAGAGTQPYWVMITHRAAVATEAMASDDTAARSVLMGRRVRWQDGSNIKLVLPSKASGELDDLSQVLGLRDAASFQRHWLKLAFSGRGDPPKFLTSSEEVLRYVRSTPGATGAIKVDGTLNLDVVDVRRL